VQPNTATNGNVEMDIDEPEPQQQPELDDVDDEDRNDLHRAIALSLAPRTRTKTLNEINELVQVFNPLLPGYESASVFMEEQHDYEPFIIRTENGNFSGEAIHWPASSSTGKDFVECRDDTPTHWQGYTYGRWIKPNTRQFIKINISGGGLSLIVKPDWYDAGVVPGTKYFHMVAAGNVYEYYYCLII